MKNIGSKYLLFPFFNGLQFIKKLGPVFSVELDRDDLKSAGVPEFLYEGYDIPPKGTILRYSYSDGSLFSGALEPSRFGNLPNNMRRSFRTIFKGEKNEQLITKVNHDIRNYKKAAKLKIVEDKKELGLEDVVYATDFDETNDVTLIKQSYLDGGFIGEINAIVLDSPNVEYVGRTIRVPAAILSFLGFYNSLNVPAWDEQKIEKKSLEIIPSKSIDKDENFNFAPVIELSSSNEEELYLSSGLRSILDLNVGDKVMFAFNDKEDFYYVFKSTDESAYELSENFTVKCPAEYLRLAERYKSHCLSVSINVTIDEEYPEVKFFKIFQRATQSVSQNAYKSLQNAIDRIKLEEENNTRSYELAKKQFHNNLEGISSYIKNIKDYLNKGTLNEEETKALLALVDRDLDKVENLKKRFLTIGNSSFEVDSDVYEQLLNTRSKTTAKPLRYSKKTGEISLDSTTASDSLIDG